jgi:hypothetical protein
MKSAPTAGELTIYDQQYHRTDNGEEDRADIEIVYAVPYPERDRYESTQYSSGDSQQDCYNESAWIRTQDCHDESASTTGHQQSCYGAADDSDQYPHQNIHDLSLHLAALYHTPHP